MESLCRDSILIHIPHSGTDFPSEFRDSYTVPLLENDIDLCTDWDSEKLFRTEYPTLCPSLSKCYIDYSCIYPPEIALSLGRGPLYTHNSDGMPFRYISDQEKTYLLNEFESYHRRLSELIARKCEMYGICLLIHCHCFNNSLLPFEKNFISERIRPDICIGTDPYHTPGWLSELICGEYEKNGFSAELNYPYSHASVPANFHGKDMRLLTVSVMINKRLYIENNEFPDMTKIDLLNGIFKNILYALFS
jgi:N-formylglutamate amidohydrolase